MKKFGFKKPVKKNLKYYLKKVNIVFLVLIIFCFSFFAFYQKTTELIFSEDKIDVFQDNLEQIAFYFRNFDEDLAQLLLKIDKISKSYEKGENIFITQETQINEARNYLNKNKFYLKKVGFAKYNTILDFLGKLRVHKNEIFTLLGKDQEFNYLIILQNTNEKRPNGGFFGSFAFLSIKGGHINNFEIVDSYYPDFIAYKTYLTAPDRTKSFLHDQKIGFLTSNKFGFTNIDGKNIKDLYEKMFNETYVMSKVEQTMEPGLYEKLLHKNIKGVIFIRSDLFEEILPEFTKKIRERQFLNASVDLIRGESRGNKKEIYIKEVKQFFNQNKITIAQNIINNFDTIIQKNYIQMYFSNTSPEFNTFLSENHLSNQYSSQKIYARDTNSSNSKVDSFVSKNIQIRDSLGNILIDTSNDIIEINGLGSGDYTMNILYSLNVPEYYAKYIQELETKYNIKITEREQGILALIPAKYTYEAIPRRRETKSTVFFPSTATLHSINGELMEKEFFEAPFAKGIFYQSRIIENNKTRLITINFSL